VWDDLPDVLHYWQAEIRLMERLMVKFRDVMFTNGFMLRNWYGPGALSSYLIPHHKLRPHIVNGPPELPRDVHQASKHAYAGGRFELFSMGRFVGPVLFTLDINSAYPYAMSQAPALGENDGFWQHVEAPRHVLRGSGFTGSGFIYLTLHVSSLGRCLCFIGITKGQSPFPTWVTAGTGRRRLRVWREPQGVEICEGYEWIPADNRVPSVCLPRGNVRGASMRIGKQNVMSMPYKLGPNSMYGKFAQRVGFTTDAQRNPPSPAFPLSSPRRMGHFVHARITVQRHSADSRGMRLIAVETDGIYTTADPSTLTGITIGDGLGGVGRQGLRRNALFAERCLPSTYRQ
jgi:hypothetical protein